MADVEHSREYIAYMQSWAWEQQRLDALYRAEYRCERCGDGSSPLQIHHLTYARLGHELPSDLKAVCVPCHEIEDAERAERVAAEREARRYEQALTLWALRTFGPDWRSLNTRGWVDREYAFYLEALTLDLDAGASPPPSGDRLGWGDNRESRPSERSLVVFEQHRAWVLDFAHRLVTEQRVPWAS